ncbi:MAG: helix-turn-helix domain-containing protein [Acidimicrobiales bacterium]
MGANGDRSTSRRSKRRGDRLITPVEAGEMLRNARTSLGIELPEVHDRTGISWRNLEALESGEIQRFSDAAAASVAVRRYAELVHIDPEPLVRAVTTPVPAFAGVAGPGVSTSWAPAPDESEASGHLRRYYGDHSHLRSFTQTAQVPAVGGWTSGPVTGAVHGGGPAGAYQAPRRKQKAPWLLRFMIWFVLFLVLVGVAGISINHYKPQWLRDIHVLASSPPPTSAPSSNTHSQRPPATTHTSTTKPVTAAVTTSQHGIGTATVKVGASVYDVVVETTNSCWVEAETPGSVNPLIDRTLSAGQTVTIPVTGGQVSVELGSLAAGFTVQIGGKTVPGWTLRPDGVPFVATFTNN